MEWSGRNFEQQSGRDGDRCDHCERIALCHCGHDSIERSGSSNAIEKREPVEDEPGRQCAEYQIFQGGFIGSAVGASESDQDVEADRGEFDADKECDEICAARHEVHAALRKQGKRVVLAAGLTDDFEIAIRGQQENHDGKPDQSVHEQSERVLRDRARKARNGKLAPLLNE